MLKRITSQKLAEEKIANLSKNKKVQLPVSQKSEKVSKTVKAASTKFDEAKSQSLKQYKLDIKA